MTQSVDKQVGTLTTIEAELHLGEIGSQMFCADSMPRSDDAALEQRERRFDRVGMNFAVQSRRTDSIQGVLWQNLVRRKK